MVWIGEHWLEALGPCCSPSDVCATHLDVQHLDVHRGGMLDAAWSDLVCFAGIGPGEVLLGGRKLVGLSQRRTRHGLRLQGMVYRSPITATITGLLVGERARRAARRAGIRPWARAADRWRRLWPDSSRHALISRRSRGLPLRSRPSGVVVSEPQVGEIGAKRGEMVDIGELTDHTCRSRGRPRRPRSQAWHSCLMRRQAAGWIRKVWHERVRR